MRTARFTTILSMPCGPKPRTETANWSFGNPFYGQPRIGPVARASAACYIKDQIAETEAPCAQRLRATSGHADGAYVELEILIGMDHSMSIWNNELFGPLACIQKTSSDQEALTLMNDSTYGLSASICSPRCHRGRGPVKQV